MEIKYYDEYIKYKKLGLRIEQKENVQKFIQSFMDFNEKQQWVIENLPKIELDSNRRIRNELFEEVIFPVLLDGYNNKNINLMLWLVKLEQNYYQNKNIWEKISFKTSLQIIKECYTLDPNNTEVIEKYLEIEIRGINYSEHEWPYGILYSNNFATKDECKNILEEIPFIHKLDRNKKHEKYINEYENRVKEYMSK
ncbi:hypothetical protein FACS189485_22230 [Spirochaetia bacterium]|nr:hypothetical protein FACS189485_22230 [Spirochaetia bacterium]